MSMRIGSILILAFLIISACKNPQEKLIGKIKQNEQILFNDSLRTLNDSVANVTIEMYKSYARQFPEDSSAAEYLFKAADLALGVQKGAVALECLKTLIEKYPGSAKASSALFMQAFINETVLDDKEMAKSIFNQFMEKYPNHPLYTSAKASYEQLQAGLSDEDLIRLFESRQDSFETAKAN